MTLAAQQAPKSRSLLVCLQLTWLASMNVDQIDELYNVMCVTYFRRMVNVNIDNHWNFVGSMSGGDVGLP